MEPLGLLERELKQVIPSLQRMQYYAKGLLFLKAASGYESKVNSNYRARHQLWPTTPIGEPTLLQVGYTQKGDPTTKAGIQSANPSK